jgi:hypothetical protein
MQRRYVMVPIVLFAGSFQAVACPGTPVIECKPLAVVGWSICLQLLTNRLFVAPAAGANAQLRSFWP